jgi:serine/threonine-protein kinase RsbW
MSDTDDKLPPTLRRRLRMSLELELPSDVQYIAEVVELIQRQCHELDFPTQKCSLNIPVALSEALANAILHGNRENPNKRVTVRTEITSDRLVVEVQDEGGGLDISHDVRDPTLADNLLREDGRGLFLMTRLMDRIERFDSGGNVVRMTLNRHG